MAEPFDSLAGAHVAIAGEMKQMGRHAARMKPASRQHGRTPGDEIPPPDKGGRYLNPIRAKIQEPPMGRPDAALVIQDHGFAPIGHFGFEFRRDRAGGEAHIGVGENRMDSVQPTGLWAGIIVDEGNHLALGLGQRRMPANDLARTRIVEMMEIGEGLGVGCGHIPGRIGGAIVADDHLEPLAIEVLRRQA